MKWMRCAVPLAAAGLAGVVVAVSGIVPIKASSGHWALTRWVLEFAKNRSVATHTLGVRVPPLDDPGLALKGAGHYHSSCQPCHGSPGKAAPWIARVMTPAPPDLALRAAARQPEELFYIVKHGIKFTGMPAWPARGRDDEVWAMVAFLRRLPGLDAAAYRELVFGPGEGGAMAGSVEALSGRDGQAPRVVVETCARCHGSGGRGRGAGAVPRLRGQRAVYLELALEAFAAGRRASGIMGPVAAALRPEERGELARYYASLAAEMPARVAGDPAAAARGARIASEGIAAQRVPACRHCHGPVDRARHPAYPDLSGQEAGYLVLQLELLQQDRRGGSPWAHLMRTVAGRLDAGQIRDVAAYYASLGGPERAQ